MRELFVSETIAAPDITTAVPTPRQGTGRVAWMVLLGAFLVFCFICIGTLVGVNYFVFQSTVPMQTVLDVSRGTAGYVENDPLVEIVVREQRHFMSVNQKVSTDLQSQATIFFQDSVKDDVRLIAAVTMQGGTTATLGMAQKPRFEWSSSSYSIELTNVAGELDIFVPENIDRDFLLTIETPTNIQAYIVASGHYSLNITDDSTQLQNYSGQVVLDSPRLQQPRDVAVGQIGMVTPNNTNDEYASVPGYMNLLSADLLDSMTGESLDLPELWQCGNIQSPPLGEFDVSRRDGLTAVRFLRANNASTHGETFCLLPLGMSAQEGLDVTSFDYLALEARLYINYQSLSVCGIEGSECPLMMQIDYLYIDEAEADESNRVKPARWYHGFYYDSATPDYPRRCSSCILDHDNVYHQSWHVYNSGNLFANLPPNQRPISVLRVRLYASGHQYDVYVRDIALLAGHSVNPGANETDVAVTN